MMKHSFVFTLEGRDWSRLYLWYWVPSLLLIILSVAAPQPDPKNPGAVLGSMGVSLALSFLTTLVSSYFTVPILRTWLPHLSINQKSFTFAGDTNHYLVLNVKGFLLTLVTFGIYFPWWARNVLDYLARETTFEGSAARFTGRPGRLLGILFGAFAVVIVVAALVGVATAKASGFSGREWDGVGSMDTAALGMTMVTFALVFIVFIPLMYLIYAWMVQFTWKGTKILWQTKLLPASLVIFAQTLLAILSLGIWIPGAFLILYRYFVARTVVLDESGDSLIQLSFEGRVAEGFGLIWGQTLLLLVTLGFYGAWSGPNVARWLAAHTFAEERTKAATVASSVV